MIIFFVGIPFNTFKDLGIQIWHQIDFA